MNLIQFRLVDACRGAAEKCKDIRHSGRLALTAIKRYDVVELEISANLKALTLEGINPTKVGATVGCFAGLYSLSQRWGEAFMRHPATLDGLIYIGRRSGARCLALFGDEGNSKDHQASLTITRAGALADALEFWQVADELELAVF